MQGNKQNTLSLTPGGVVTINYDSAVPLEFLNLGEGVVWMKWTGDFQPVVSSSDSTPLPPGMSYQRTLSKVAVVADKATTFVVNIL